MPALDRLRRCCAVAFIAAYLALTAFFLARHAIGDASGHPIAYFWTWDMFPNYPTESARRRAIGECASGRFIQLVPNDRHPFRWGVRDDVTRFDLDRRLSFFRRAALDAAARHNAAHADDPVEHVYLAERYWPQKFNLSDDLYRAFYHDPVTGEIYWATPAAAGDALERSYWRILDDEAVPAKDSAAVRERSP